jgi:hypothetical protein
MPSDKNKVVRYTGSNSSQRGDIQYWDGNNWVSLQIGLTGDILTAHGIGVPPSWEGQSIIVSSSSSSFVSSSSSSSSYITPEPPVALPSVPFDQPLGINSQTNSLAREEVHLVMQPKGATETRDRQGNVYTNVEGPFAAPWNWDDNNSGNELLYFGFKDPLTNKYIGVSYTQTKYLSFGYYISEIRVKSYEISGGDTGSSILSGGPRQYTIESDGVFDITCDNAGDVTGSLVGVQVTSSSSSSLITSVDISLPPPEPGKPIMIPDPPNKLTIDIPLFTLEISRFPGSGFDSYSMNLVPKTTYMQESVYSGGEIGGLWYEIMKNIRDYGDNGGQVDQNGVPVPTLNSSSSNVVVGCWGWYKSDVTWYFSSSSSSSSPSVPSHFIPINRISDDFNIDINEFIGTDARATLEAANVVENVDSYVNPISFFEANVIATIWNLIQDPNSKGYWNLNWCDPSMRINGDLICCLNGLPVPSMEITVTANDADLPVTWCGITWEKLTTTLTNANQRHSGDSANVCPNGYGLGREKGSITSTFSVAFKCTWAFENWTNFQGGNQLRLMRNYMIQEGSTFDPGSAFRYAPAAVPVPNDNAQRLQVLNIPGDNQLFRNYNRRKTRPIPPAPTSTFSFNIPYFSMGILNAGEIPYYDNYRLTDSFFDGSVTNNGVTYAWSRGRLWNQMEIRPFP